MKKIMLIVAALLLTGCNNSSLEQNESTGKKIVEVGWEASCVDYEIQDENDVKIEVPSEVENALKCSIGVLDISLDQKYLVYAYDNYIKIYNFEDETMNTLIEIEDDIEGIACEWDHTGNKIACALINQQKYEGGTKFVVIELENGDLSDSKEYTITHETMADFVCGASCYPGSFWFENDNLIKYEGHNIVAPGEIFDIQL